MGLTKVIHLLLGIENIDESECVKCRAREAIAQMGDEAQKLNDSLQKVNAAHLVDEVLVEITRDLNNDNK